MEIWNNDKRLSSFVNYQKAKIMIGGQFKSKIKLRTESFSGVKTIGVFYMREDLSCRFDLEFEVTKGRAKIILVRKGIITPVISETNQRAVIFKLQKGFNRIRIVGEHADARLTLLMKKGVTSL
ncbi:MAG: hypothetical protein PHD98_02130 [Bacilli bacterium]|jgi:hypothetical protein|nr:hypothetical protein [Bacilli bacterium]MDD4005948.1 hypothetical protein [Bacilli bacterium]